MIDPDLARLAAAWGVATSYLDQLRRPVPVDPSAIVAVLGALGVDATTPEAVQVSLRAAPPPSASASASASAGAEPVRVPARAGRGWGWMVQLYALRSAESWGVGDIADLRRIAVWTAEHGGDLVLVNPLHAVAPTTPMQPSPYFPASRRWTNPLYLHVEDTPAYRQAGDETRARVAAMKPSYDVERIDRDIAWTAKLQALELLWEAGSWAVAADDDLLTFATWCVLCELHGPDWRTWPEPLRRPDADAVAAARDEHADRVRFHAWLQVLCDEQLAAAQAAAREAGMAVGIVHDLAVGADPGGADAWAWQDALALGARVGAPPDGFNQQGQDWGFPPWHPHRLAELGYEPLRRLVRSTMQHAGGVRVDHVLGLFRLWWVPPGASPRGGAYVGYDAATMLDLVATEAERSNAVVVGEDLGTVPDEVRATLADRGVLGSSVLWFERDEVEPGQLGPLRAMDDWREPAMASVTTHDLPTVLGWLRGEHVRVRRELGLLDDPAAEEKAWRAERLELLQHVVAAGVLASVDAPEEELARALHRYVAATPSRYVLAAPGDAVGDLRQPNQPGTVDEYPNWRLPVADSAGRPFLLDELLADPRVERLAADLDEQVR